MTKNILQFTGNLLIICSLALALFIYYPLIQLYVSPVTPQPVRYPDTPTIWIPSISALAPITMDVDPWDRKIYSNALSKGVAHASSTSKPGEQGSVFLFAHSSGNPWEITRQNTAFLRLNELKNGDTITIYFDQSKYDYFVFDKKIVQNTQTQYLTDQTKTQLILQTCAPLGTD